MAHIAAVVVDSCVAKTVEEEQKVDVDELRHDTLDRRPKRVELFESTM